MNSPFTASLINTLPDIGIQLQTGINFRQRGNYYRYTSALAQKFYQCEQCGIFFLYSGHKRHFCSKSCAAKYSMTRYYENRRKLIYKNLNHVEFNIFYKKYNSYVINLIYSYDAEYRENLLEWWQDYAIICFSNIRKLEQLRKSQIARFAYIKKCVYYTYLTIVKEKTKEIFYDECPISIQQKILGTFNERN